MLKEVSSAGLGFFGIGIVEGKPGREGRIVEDSANCEIDGKSVLSTQWKNM